MRQLLNAMYGGRGPQGEDGFTVEEGLVFENLPIVRPTRLLSEKVYITRLRTLAKSNGM